MRIWPALATLLIATPSLAADMPEKTSFALRASTLGLGVEVARALPIANLTGRVAWNTYTYGTSETIQGVPYGLDLELDNFTALLDWRPWGQATFLTAGLVFNNNQIAATGRATDTYTLGGTTFSSADVGTLTGNASFDDVVAYAGLGWNLPLATRTALSFELGVVFQGPPRLSLTADGLLAQDDVFQAELENERAQFEADIEDYQYYPVIGVGILRRF